MFLNQHHHSFDDKGRLTIPSKFRELPPEGAFVVPGFDHNLMVLPPAVFNVLYDHLTRLNLTDPAARQLQELMLGNAVQVVPDGSGRIMLPPNLRTYAELKSDVVFLGLGDRFEIWAEELWQKRQELLNNPELETQRYAAIQLTTR
jgi:MraZ protein